MSGHDDTTLTPQGRLAVAIVDLCWRATPFGTNADGDIEDYLLTAGTVHRLIGAAQGMGIHAAFRVRGAPPARRTMSDCPDYARAYHLDDDDSDIDLDTTRDDYADRDIDERGDAAARVLRQSEHPDTEAAVETLLRGWGLCGAGVWSREIAAALAAAGLLADPTTSRTDDEQAVIDAASAARKARIKYDQTHQRVLFHGGHPNESVKARDAFDAAYSALDAAVDRLTATGPKEATGQ